ncbi:uncharacterized protein LOC144331908 isoform X8 [Macaca mulatta]
MPLWSVWPGAGRAGIPRVTLSRTQTLTSSTMQDCSGLCFCTRHQLPALMTSTSPPAWSDTVVTTSARPDDGLFLRCSPQCKDEDDNEVGDDDDDDGDVKCGLQSLPMEVRCRQKQQQRPGFLRNCSQFEEGRKSHLQ